MEMLKSQHTRTEKARIEELEAKRRQVQDLQSQIKAISNSRDQLQSSLNHQKNEKQKVKRQLATLTEEYNKSIAELELVKHSFAQAQERERAALEQLSAEVAAKKQATNRLQRIESQSSKSPHTASSAISGDDTSMQPMSGRTSLDASLGILPENRANYVILDLETTGFSENDEIVEIALIEIKSTGEVVDRFETTISCYRDSNPRALEVHQLTRADLFLSPSFQDVAHAVANFMHGKILVSHNLSFDLRFLDRAFKGVDGLAVDFGQGVDTLYSGNQRTKASLGDLCGRFNLEYEAHTAMGDAEALLALMMHGYIKPFISGREHEAKAKGLMRPGDCELRPRSAIPVKQANQGKSKLDELISQNGLSLGKGPMITLEDGDKACCSCSTRNSTYRDSLYAKHAELGLLSARSVSAGHKCIVLENLSSETDKALQARRLKIPMIHADDFIACQKGEPLQSWIFLSDSDE